MFIISFIHWLFDQSMDYVPDNLSPIIAKLLSTPIYNNEKRYAVSAMQ